MEQRLQDLWGPWNPPSLSLGVDRPCRIQMTHLRAPEIAAVCTGTRRHPEKSLPPRRCLQKYLLPHKGEDGRGENQASEKEKYLNTFRRDLQTLGTGTANPPCDRAKVSSRPEGAGCGAASPPRAGMWRLAVRLLAGSPPAFCTQEEGPVGWGRLLPPCSTNWEGGAERLPHLPKVTPGGNDSLGFGP